MRAHETRSVRAICCTVSDSTAKACKLVHVGAVACCWTLLLPAVASSCFLVHTFRNLVPQMPMLLPYLPSCGHFCLYSCAKIAKTLGGSTGGICCSSTGPACLQGSCR
jgi:hypothetical protein